MHVCVVGHCHWNAGREELDWRVVGGITDAMCADYTDYYTILYNAMGVSMESWALLVKS